MIYLETSHKDTRNEYNQDEEGKDNRQPEPDPIYPLLRYCPCGIVVMEPSSSCGNEIESACVFHLRLP